MNSQTLNSNQQHSGRSIKKLYRKAVRALRTSSHADALELTQEIISRQPDHAGAHAVQFSSLYKSKEFERARQIGNQAAELNPKSVFILNNQACLELDVKNPEPAAHLLTSLIDQFGERAQWLYNLGLSHGLNGHNSKAITTFRRTLDQNPEHDKAARQLAETLERVGHYEEASQAYDYWRLLTPNDEKSHAQYIHCATISDNISVNSLKMELAVWGDKFIPKGSRYEVADLSKKQTLHIGFISSVLPKNWVTRVIAPLAQKLANNGDRVSFYCHNMQLKFNKNVHSFDVTRLSDADFARRVRKDEIDVLIDLCGMKKSNRQRALGLQLASKQYSWLSHEGMFATPLLHSLDDALANQDDTLAFFVKANNYISPPSKQAWPEKTFAGIAAQQGLSYTVIKTWAQVMLRNPQWQLHIQTENNPAVEKLLLQRFSATGINRERLRFDTQLAYDSTTIILDNFICNDHVSLSDALLCGANAVTVDGAFFSAQKSAKLMQQLNVDQGVVGSEFEFIEYATMLATKGISPSENNDLQAQQSRLGDIDSFAKQVRHLILN